MERERYTLRGCEYHRKLPREIEVHTQLKTASTTVNYRGREGYILKGWEHHNKLPREIEVHTPGLLVTQYTTEGERGTHSGAGSTTVNYRGRERYTLEDCEYHRKLQRDREVHTKGL